MTSRPPPALAVAWFVVQGLAVAAWWALLMARPSARSWFLPPGNDASALLAFSLPDALLLVGGSLVTAILCARDHRWALPLAWLVAGATDYATLHVLGWALLAGGGWASFVAMAPCALISTTFALDLASAHVPIYRRARAASAGWNVLKTLSQIVVFWTLFLGVVPLFLLRIESSLALPRFDFPGRPAPKALKLVFQVEEEE